MSIVYNALLYDRCYNELIWQLLHNRSKSILLLWALRLSFHNSSQYSFNISSIALWISRPEMTKTTWNMIFLPSWAVFGLNNKIICPNHFRNALKVILHGSSSPSPWQSASLSRESGWVNRGSRSKVIAQRLISLKKGSWWHGIHEWMSTIKL